MFKKIDINRIKQESYDLGRAHQKETDSGLVAKRAQDLYSQQNWLVNPNHVFQVTKDGIPYLDMDPITKEKLKELQHQAKFLQDTELWAVLTTLVRQKAIEQAINKSTSWEHVLPGKMMVHNIALLEGLVKYIAEVDISKVPDASGKNKENMLS